MVALAWRYRWRCVFVLILQFSLLLMQLCGLGLVGTGIDFLRHQFNSKWPQPRWWFGFEPPASWSPMLLVVLIAGGIILLAATRSLINYLVVVGTSDLIQRRLVVDLRRAAYDKLQRLSFRFFDENESGSIINRVTRDVVQTSSFLSGVLLGLINTLIAATVYVVYMLNIHVTLTLAVMGTLPLLMVLAVVFTRLIRRDLRVFFKLNDKMILTLSENVQGVHVVKGFARQQQQINKFAGDNKAVNDCQRRIFFWMSLFAPATGFMTQVSTIIVLAFGGYLVVLHDADPTHSAGIALGAGLLVFASLTNQFASQVQFLADVGSRAQEHLESAARVFEIIDTPSDIASPPQAVPLRKARGSVTFDAVTFGYKTGDAVLHDINFDVEPGRCVALAGPTGCGKSTLLSLIPRFYDPNFGRVMIDGVDARRLDLDHLRRNVGLVFQESFLFSNTIASNIAFGHPQATQQQIEQAAKIACAHDFIMELPSGYDTVIGERGADLSGGQRQRLAIARAVLLEPAILILDDPTAAIDPETEHEILAAMDNAMKDRTTFVVSHRLSTSRRADTVLVMDKGRIVQRGTHDQLMSAKGHYRSAASLQQADEETKRLLDQPARQVI